MRENMKLGKEMSRETVIDWNKFKVEATGKHLETARNSYIEFCKMLDEVGFELVSDYIRNKGKVKLIYKLDDNIILNITPNHFKCTTYKRIINFKNKLKKNNDKFIRFVKLTPSGNFVAQIQTFDNGIIDIDISQYNSFSKGRQDFYNKLKEIGGHTTDYYINDKEKMNIYVDNIKLNPVIPSNFKRTHKTIINFKNNLKNNGDEFIKFTGLTNDGSLIVKIKTFDGVEVLKGINSYSRWRDSRQSTYDYCKEKGYKILSSYIKDGEKILIDFNCGHEPHWIRPNSLKKYYGCPICNESKGEKVVRLYLENNNINFIQEYRFEDCRYKNLLRFDFYIPNRNLCIEYDGMQHFKSFDYFGGEERLKVTQKRDKIKNRFCEENNINLLRIPYYELDNIDKILDREFGKPNNPKEELKVVC